MKDYLLDTNMVSHYFYRHANVLARIQSLDDGDKLWVSSVTLGEIAFGNAVTNSTDHERRTECERFINNEFHGGITLPISRSTRIYYGDLKAELFRRFPPSRRGQNHPERCFERATGVELGIDENDLWIAAQALEHNLVLVTNDEMARIREVASALTLALDIEDWTQPRLGVS